MWGVPLWLSCQIFPVTCIFFPNLVRDWFSFCSNCSSLFLRYIHWRKVIFWILCCSYLCCILERLVSIVDSSSLSLFDCRGLLWDSYMISGYGYVVNDVANGEFRCCSSNMLFIVDLEDVIQSTAKAEDLHLAWKLPFPEPVSLTSR